VSENPSAQNPENGPAEQVIQQFIEDTDELLKLPSFRRWLFYVIDHPDFCASHALRVDTHDVHQTFMDAGARKVGLELTSLAQKRSPPLYMRMLKEAHNQRANYEEARPSASEE
jgi:hypothetical protein